VSGTQNYLAEFLRARRELLQPEEVGLPREDGRRVPGLRREEVAVRAGISVDYYLRLEQGRDHQPSEQVLSALGRALLLDQDATAYLHRIVQLSTGYRRRAAGGQLPEGVTRLLDQWWHTPAYVSDANLDIVAVNEAARVLAPGFLEPGVNLLLSVFAAGEDAYDDEDWQRTADTLVAALRFHADPTDPRFQEILGQLSVDHRAFRRLWSRHEAQPQSGGAALHHIEPFGWVNLHYQTLDIPTESGLFLTTFYADEGSTGADALAAILETAGRRRAG
jgi:transcriptional regulator with XRE-family HTH domain